MGKFLAVGSRRHTSNVDEIWISGPARPDDAGLTLWCYINTAALGARPVAGLAAARDASRRHTGPLHSTPLRYFVSRRLCGEHSALPQRVVAAVIFKPQYYIALIFSWSSPLLCHCYVFYGCFSLSNFGVAILVSSGYFYIIMKNMWLSLGLGLKKLAQYIIRKNMLKCLHKNSCPKTSNDYNINKYRTAIQRGIRSDNVYLNKNNTSVAQPWLHRISL